MGIWSEQHGVPQSRCPFRAQHTLFSQLSLHVVSQLPQKL
jgi:hypothetical protein